MSSTKLHPLIAATFTAFVVLVLYVIVCIALFLIAFMGLKNQKIFHSGIMHSYQAYLYINGLRNIWQAQSDCVQFDKDLLYKPKEGSCNFKNLEFETVLWFDKHGRLGGSSHYLYEGEGIAVVGDSHAMGWGVEDHQTFSAVLQQKLKRPVFNLAVSSYGTYRELLRLEKSGLLDKVDTIIIQYSDNDILENLLAAKVGKGNKHYEQSALDEMTQPSQPRAFSRSWEWTKVSLKVPIRDTIRHVKKLFRNSAPESTPFKEHFDAFEKVTAMFPWLSTKQVMVFYSNGWGVKFSGFSEKSIPNLPRLKFIDLEIGMNNYYVVDDHLTPSGHIEIAEKLSRIINASSPN
jgi:hypothetical protein